jgi:hypothetical protein
MYKGGPGLEFGQGMLKPDKPVSKPAFFRSGPPSGNLSASFPLQKLEQSILATAFFR